MENKKYKILFPFVEAGLGHIMPLRAIADAFEQKYGDRAEIIRTSFFSDRKDSDMNYVQDELVKEVKLHNKCRGRGAFQFALMRLVGSRVSLKYLMRVRYRRAYKKSLAYLKSVNADMIVNTHFSTLFYACELKKSSKARIVAYCPDPVIGLQWDRRLDLLGVSSELGKIKAKGWRNKEERIKVVPFLIRSEVKDYTRNKQHYRNLLGIPEDNFTIMLADGAYGAGKLRQTFFELLKAKQEITIIAACGKNEQLFKEISSLSVPQNITVKAFGFTDQMLNIAACCDLFVGKAGASNLAEPAYFGAPAIITMCATPIEKWICSHYVREGCALKITDPAKAADLALRWAQQPSIMQPFAECCKKQGRHDGAQIFADILWQALQEKSNSG